MPTLASQKPSFLSLKLLMISNSISMPVNDWLFNSTLSVKAFTFYMDPLFTLFMLLNMEAGFI